jgi:hypothetical protein
MFVPSMADTDNVIDVAECKLQKLIGKNTGDVCEAKERMIGEYSPQTHCSRMHDCSMAKVAQARMPMHDFNLLSNDDVSKYGEERKDGRKCRLAIYDKKGDVIDFQAIGKISNSSSALVRMGDDYHLMTSIYELLQI